jgi:aryl-alcohol dehydrogenase-like predicted oxidoreductase
MKSTALGATGVSISAIGLGGFELGPERGQEPDLAGAQSLLAAAESAGINWVDTSENYHDNANEELIGAALGSVGGDFLVTTKVAPSAGLSAAASGFRREQIHRGCRSSLQRLQRDHIDVYLLHWPDRSGDVPLEESWGAMAELADEGLVRAVGLSNYELPDIERAHRQRSVDLIQTGLSLVHCLEDRPLIGGCADLGIPVTIYEPLAGGILSGQTLAEQRERWAAYADSGFYRNLLEAERGERSAAVAAGVGRLAERKGCTTAQLAIAWVLHQRGIVAALAGTRKPARVAENARAADVDASDVIDDLEALIPLGPAFA